MNEPEEPGASAFMAATLEAALARDVDSRDGGGAAVNEPEGPEDFAPRPDFGAVAAWLRAAHRAVPAPPTGPDAVSRRTALQCALEAFITRGGMRP